MRRRARRILELAGFDVATGVPVADDLIGVWGRSPTAWRGEAVAGWTEAPILTVEDAFLRSVLPGRVGGDEGLGLVLDKRGVHFDGEEPSEIERILATEPLDDTQLLNRARGAIERLKYWHLGKYCATDPTLEAPAPGYVLVLDQTEGDAALMGATRPDFHEMLVRAAEENPGSDILIKVHPETIAGARKGHFDGELPVDRARLFTSDISPWVLFEGAVAVYTHSSNLGFEAIFAGHRPYVFGRPFYAGWGRTIDELVFPRRQRELTRAQLFAGAMILYPTWYDPMSDRLCEIEDVISSLAAKASAWRQDRDGYVAVGMRRWKRRHLKQAYGREKPLAFSKASSAARKAAKDGRKVVAWGQIEAPVDAIRMEDGFLRSKGLGADLVPPVSLVLDDVGLYYDPGKPSKLDQLIINSEKLPLAEIERSEHLTGQMVNKKLTKYNLQEISVQNFDQRQKVLVVGQVEDDASVILGAHDVCTNLNLLKMARAENPDALILWKPHPDVEVGLRTGAVDEANLEGLADVALNGVGADQALALCDRVWTMTSTMGFEALLRGKPVTCLGMPFYAGWGLTDDRAPRPRHRTRDVRLAELAHACLIGYPRYFDPETGEAISAEQAVYLLSKMDAPVLGTASFGQRLLRKLGL